MANKESCQQKGHLKAIWNKRPQVWGPTRTTSDTHFQFCFRVLNISPHLLNCNSTYHKYGKSQRGNFCIPYGSAKFQAFVNSVHFTFGTGENMQVPLSLKHRF